MYYIKVFSSFFIILFLLFNFNLASADNEQGLTMYNTNLRTGPSTAYSIVKVIPKNTVLNITEEKSNWYKITDNKGLTGWMAEWLIKKTLEKSEQSSDTNIYESGIIITDARMRAGASTEYEIYKVLKSGSKIQILSENNGWYKIKDSTGKIGWTAGWLIDKADMDQKIRSDITTPTENSIDKKMTDQTGVTIYNSRVRQGPSTNYGIIQVLSAGEKIELLANENGWYKIKDKLGSTGWTAAWLINTESNSINSETQSEINISSSFDNSKSTAPSDVDEDELNRYWVERINALRVKKNLRQLVIDNRFRNTAQEYAIYMGDTGAKDHSRSDGKTMHEWIDTKNLDFTQRYSPEGWNTNYFTENIAWRKAEGTTESIKKQVLDPTLQLFLDEAPYNGDHYRTIFHKDWNSVGVGFHFKKIDDDLYYVNVVFHYGSLVL
ncbi:MAG: SH3 domain-containing protein [Candidatus Magasanikbacteria bacterium]|nr:SH3 domain-containing protein [Candidatus Magasanikbacteria bacterium]